VREMGQFELLKNSFFRLNNLLIFRSILNDNLYADIQQLILDLNKYISEDHNKKYYEICHRLIKIAERERFQGDLLQNYLLKLIALDKNPLSLRAEKFGSGISPGLYQAALHDIKIIKGVYRFTLSDIGVIIGIGEISYISHYSPTLDDNLNRSPLHNNFSNFRYAFSKDELQEILSSLISYYNSAGCGKLSQYIAFRYDFEQRGLRGVRNLDPVTFDDLIGYKEQKEQLIENTELFLNGKKANNVLLYGDSGTGKSSSIKALVNKYFYKGLRLIEIDKNMIEKIPELLELLEERGLYFVIFMDDLSFEDFETEYKYLKAVMEGGLESKPDNVLFYATSNRRHIVKENWEDRSEGQGEVHQSDAVQEKLSLADRFGLTITYPAPDRNQYLEIVKGLARKNNLSLPEEELLNGALKWEMWHHGRSGRTARQYINHLAGKK